jgi:putative transposase
MCPSVQRFAYESDVTDVEWLLIEGLLPAAKPGGRPRDTEVREVVNSIFYVVRTGCAWRLLAHDLLPWQTVYGYFRDWNKKGVFQSINTALREAVREQEEHEAQASAGSLDSQSVKTMNADANGRGFDGAKLLTGRKRFLLVDTLGLVLHAFVTSAKTPERAGAQLLLTQTPEEILAHLELLWADGGFDGVDFTAWVQEHCACLVEIVKRSDDVKGFVVLPRRWVVERTFGWFGYFRRLSKDYERRASSSVAFIFMAMIRLMLQRLAKNSMLFA